MAFSQIIFCEILLKYCEVLLCNVAKTVKILRKLVPDMYTIRNQFLDFLPFLYNYSNLYSLPVN